MKLIELYLSRFDEELEQIKMKHNIGNRKNRQHASREDVILLTKLHEKEEFHTCGLEIPDLLNPKQLEMLIKWEGELRFLQNFKLKRYSLKQLQGLANRAGTGKSVSARVSENEAASKNVEMTEGTEDSGNTKVLLESEDYNKIEVQESEGSDSQNEKKSDVNEVEGHPNDKNQISESTGMEVDS
ncbi:hypothetical protein C0J52_17820 [Blattella germanica]|nr:hypothetical protein C0J52_17820 [Blattella germanica]